MTAKAKAVVHAARALAKMKTPSIAEILSKRGFVYEAGKVQELMDAVEQFDAQIPPPKK